MSDGVLTPPVGPVDHRSGPDDAPVVLVEYGDFECPYCRMAYPIVQMIQRKMKDQLQLVFRHFPLREIHPHAQHAAEIAEAAAKQGKFWEMHDILFEEQHALDDVDLLRYATKLKLDVTQVTLALEMGEYTKVVRDQFRSGVRSGVNGTPTFFINGARYNGPWADPNAFLRAVRRD